MGREGREGVDKRVGMMEGGEKENGVVKGWLPAQDPRVVIKDGSLMDGSHCQVYIPMQMNASFELLNYQNNKAWLPGVIITQEGLEAFHMPKKVTGPTVRTHPAIPEYHFIPDLVGYLFGKRVHYPLLSIPLSLLPSPPFPSPSLSPPSPPSFSHPSPGSPSPSSTPLLPSPPFTLLSSLRDDTPHHHSLQAEQPSQRQGPTENQEHRVHYYHM